MIQKIKKQKPIECDIHFKYLCSCGQFHWLTYNEASTKDFFIVCDCKKKIKIKTIDTIKIKYKKPHKKNKTTKTKEIENKEILSKVSDGSVEQTTSAVAPIVEHTLISDIKETQSNKAQEIPQELLNSCVNLMYTFGYNRKDAYDLIKAFYFKNPVNEYKTFVNNLLASIKG